MKKYLFLVLVFMVVFIMPALAQVVAEPVVKFSFLELIINNIGVASSGVFGLLAMVFGGKFAFIKNKFTQLVDLLDEIENAIKDDKITKEEMLSIVEKINILLGRKKK